MLTFRFFCIALGLFAIFGCTNYTPTRSIKCPACDVDAELFRINRNRYGCDAGYQCEECGGKIYTRDGEIDEFDKPRGFPEV